MPDLQHGLGRRLVAELVEGPEIGERSRIHPLVILFGILGGIQLIGIPGIIIGPLVLGLVDVVMGIFREVV